MRCVYVELRLKSIYRYQCHIGHRTSGGEGKRGTVQESSKFQFGTVSSNFSCRFDIMYSTIQIKMYQGMIFLFYFIFLYRKCSYVVIGKFFNEKEKEMFLSKMFE